MTDKIKLRDLDQGVIPHRVEIDSGTLRAMIAAVRAAKSHVEDEEDLDAWMGLVDWLAAFDFD